MHATAEGVPRGQKLFFSRFSPSVVRSIHASGSVKRLAPANGMLSRSSVSLAIDRGHGCARALCLEAMTPDAVPTSRTSLSFKGNAPMYCSNRPAKIPFQADHGFAVR